MMKLIGTKSGQGVRCSKAGIFVGVSSNSSCIIGFVLESKKMVRVYHFVAQPDLSRRPALLLASDDLWNSQSAPVSPTLDIVQKGIREIFQQMPMEKREHMEIMIDPMTHLPVKYVPHNDDIGNLYLLPVDHAEPILQSPPPIRSTVAPRNRTTSTRVAADIANKRIAEQLGAEDEFNINEPDTRTGSQPSTTPLPHDNELMKL